MSSEKKTTAAMEAVKPALVPKLRFPEFRGAAAWKPITIKEVSTPVTERVGEKKLTPISISAGIGFVPQAEKFGRDISGNQYQLYTLVRDGDFVFNKGNSLKFPQGCVYLLQGWGQVAAPNVFICFRLKDGYSNGFFQNCFEQNQHGRQLKRHITSGARSNGLLNISKETFFAVEISTPVPAEQQMIAECLSSVDELMGAQARKVDALKTHKKGLMQQLFPREGETQPRLRFPEFQNAGEWEMRELCQFITERNVYPKKKVPLFSLTIEDGVTPKTERYERSFLVNDEAEAYKLVLPNDFAFNPMNLRFGAIGRHGGTEAVAVSKYYNIFSCDKTVDSMFCETYFRSERMVAFYDDRAIGSLIEKRRVQFAAFLKFNIRFPGLLEQQRIASCLSSLDAVITAETQKLKALKTHKRGLMQQLFPAPEAVEA